MAKKTVVDLMADLESALGLNADNQAVENFIDTGYPPLNYAISGRYDGGLPQGRLVEMFGDSSTGKTALATKFMVEAQRMGGVAGFIDWERSFDAGLGQGFGLNIDRPYWLYTKPQTWEEGNVYAAKACKIIRESGVIAPEAPILFVFDSIAAALPKSMVEDSKGKERSIDEYTMNDTTALARVSSTTLKSMAQIADAYNATFLYLNQIRLKPGVVYGDPRTTPGGRAMEYYATVRIALGRSKVMETVGGEKDFVGQKITMQVVKSKLTKPFKEAEMRLMYDECEVASFDVVHSTLEYLIEKGAIEYSKPYVTWNGKKYHVKSLAAEINGGPVEEKAKLLAMVEAQAKKERAAAE